MAFLISHPIQCSVSVSSSGFLNTKRKLNTKVTRLVSNTSTHKKARSIWTGCIEIPSNPTSLSDTATALTKSDAGVISQRGARLKNAKSIIPETSLDPNKLSADEMHEHWVSAIGWIGIAAAFVPIIGHHQGWDEALQYMAAYLVEYSMSVDNLFIFMMIFSHFGIPRSLQKRVLSWGILGAIITRGGMIVAGTQLIRRFRWMTLVFAALLLFSAGKMLLSDDDEAKAGLEDNNWLSWLSKQINLSEELDGDKFFIVHDGVRFATPLFLTLLCIEISDVIFAFDSVPAVLGISKDIMDIYLSNILAVQGLRSLFFIISNYLSDFRFLSQSLSVIIAFVACKMIGSAAGYEVPVVASLVFIISSLSAGVGLSIAFPETKKSV